MIEAKAPETKSPEAKAPASAKPIPRPVAPAEPAGAAAGGAGWLSNIKNLSMAASGHPSKEDEAPVLAPAVPELIYWVMADIWLAMPDGWVIQPSRQPVIAQALEKLLTENTRSSSSANCRIDGATGPSK